MRKLFTPLLLCISISAEAQMPANAPLNPEWVYLRDYTFERMEATRAVHDVWIYADRDPFYNEAGRQGILKAWRDAGGKAEYLLVTEHTLPNLHGILSNAPTGNRSWTPF